MRIDEKLNGDELLCLRKIRRAAMAIRSCAEIINEHESNAGSVPSGPRVFIRLEKHQENGLEYAIEACAKVITDAFDSDTLDDVGFQEEICPGVTAEAKDLAAMQNGALPYEEFKARHGGCRI